MHDRPKPSFAIGIFDLNELKKRKEEFAARTRFFLSLSHSVVFHGFFSLSCSRRDFLLPFHFFGVTIFVRAWKANSLGDSMFFAPTLYEVSVPQERILAILVCMCVCGKLSKTSGNKFVGIMEFDDLTYAHFFSNRCLIPHSDPHIHPSL